MMQIEPRIEPRTNQRVCSRCGKLIAEAFFVCTTEKCLGATYCYRCWKVHSCNKEVLYSNDKRYNDKQH